MANVKEGFSKWDNPVRMSCRDESGPAKMGEEMFPGGYGHGCSKDAYFVEVRGGVAVSFYCYEHGKRAGA